MKKYIIPFFFAGVIFMSFGNVTSALVIQVGATTTANGSTEIMTNIDLGIENVGMLPTSSFYFLKEWKRSMSRMFTWNIVSRVDLELRITNEKGAEAFQVQSTDGANKDAIERAIENYTKAHDRLQARLGKLKSTSEDPKIKSLLLKLQNQSVQHATLLQQFAQRYAGAKVGDATLVSIADPDFDVLRSMIQDAQDKNMRTSVVAIEKNSDVKQRAEEQILLAETELNLLKTELAEFIRVNPEVSVSKGAIVGGVGTEAVEIAIKEQGIRKGEIATDESDATTKRQTPKRDFGDRMKAGLETAGGMLASAKTAFAEGKYGEAFGHARSAEVMVRGDLRVLFEYAIKEQGVKIFIDMKDQSVKKNIETVKPEYEDRAVNNGNPPTPTPKPSDLVACTKEAKMCPDGSSVSRTGPRCEFTECPVSKPIEGIMCTAQYDPVCGADGKTYGNACNASAAGVSVVAKGECGVKIEASVTTESRASY